MNVNNNLDDIASSSQLDDSFSNISGCGLPPVGLPTKVITGTKRECKNIPYPCPTIKEPFKKCTKEVCVNVPTVKTVPNQEYLDKLKKHKDCVASEIKKGAGNIKDNLGKVGDKVSTGVKKQVKGLKNLVGKARVAYKKLLRKQVLSAVYLSIRANKSGIATRLYPAITSDAQLKQQKFKLSYKPKSVKSYNEILKKWTNLGGKKSKLDDAIAKGAKLRILKNKKKSGFDGVTNDFDIYLGNYDFMPTFLNRTTNGVDVNRAIRDTFSGIDGDNDGYDDTTFMPIENSESLGVTDEVLTSEDTSALAQEEVSNTSEEEKVSGWQNFIAWILSMFKKNKAEENPYEEGSVDYSTFGSDYSADLPSQPEFSNDGERVMDGLDKTQTDEYEDPNAVIPEMIWDIDARIVYGAGGFLVGATIGFLVSLAMPKSSITRKIIFAGVGGVTVGAIGVFVPAIKIAMKKKKEENTEDESSEFSGSSQEEPKSNFKTGDRIGNSCYYNGVFSVEGCSKLRK